MNSSSIHRYFEYEGDIYILVGISQDKLDSLHFSLAPLALIILKDQKEWFALSFKVPMDKCLQITDKDKLDMLKLLYQI